MTLEQTPVSRDEEGARRGPGFGVGTAALGPTAPARGK
jgi:hypothetical protein